jgi:nicotinate-nucleotide adenylyltransferase
MKIGIFGGTFNPIHYGHLRAAEEVQEVFSFDRLIFVPSGKPPLKRSGIVSASHRYKMSKIAIQGNPAFHVSDIEVKCRGISYTIDTLKKFVRRYRGAEFFFILGIDAFLDLPKWRQPDEILRITNIVVISRPGSFFIDLLSSPYLKDMRIHENTLYQIDSGKRKRYSLKLKGARNIYLTRVSTLDISASRIRDIIKQGKSIKYLLPESVESYIISHKLYIRNP